MRRSHVFLGCAAAVLLAATGGAIVALDGSSGSTVSLAGYRARWGGDSWLPHRPQPRRFPGTDGGPAPSISASPSSSPAPSPTAAAPAAAPTAAATSGGGNGGGSTSGTGSTDAYPMASTDSVNQMVAQINKLRAANGRPAYTVLTGLDISAHQHNLAMAAGCGMVHQCPNEAVFGDRISALGVPWTSAGENIGKSGPHDNTPAAILQAAEDMTTSLYNEQSPDDGHRVNLLSSSYHFIGIDVIRDSQGTIWLTQDFSG